MEYIFTGNALASIGENGELTLPSCIGTAMIMRKSGKVLVRKHESDPCLVVFDRAFARRQVSELRLRCEGDRRRYDVAARSMFGCVEDASVDTDGTMVIPPMMFRRSAFGESVLVVGAGETFELWDPETAMTCGDPNLRDLVEFYREHAFLGVGS